MRQTLDRLAADRGPAFYGDEDQDIPASELFDERAARDAVTVVDRLLDLYILLLGEKA